MNTLEPHPTARRDTGSRRETLVNLAVNVVAPLVVFYGLRAAGVGQWSALLLGGVPPLIRAGYTTVVRRRIDSLGVFTLSILALSVVTSLLTGSARFLLAKDGWLTALGGLWILATLLLRSPFYLEAIRSVAPEPVRRRADTAWQRSPRFGRMMRVATAIWGAGLVADAVLRVLLAYTLPVDEVPLISTVQYVAVFLLLEVGSRYYLRRAGVRDHLGPQAQEVPA